MRGRSSASTPALIRAVIVGVVDEVTLAARARRGRPCTNSTKPVRQARAPHQGAVHFWHAHKVANILRVDAAAVQNPHRLRRRLSVAIGDRPSDGHPCNSVGIGRCGCPAVLWPTEVRRR